MEKILSSEMAVEEINKKVARKNEIVDLIKEKRASFEESDIETRDTILEEVKALEEEANSIDEEINELNETKEKYEEQEERMSMVNVFGAEAVETRKANLGTDKYDTPEYRKAWRRAVETGNETEVRGLLTELVEGGQVPVPTYVQSRVETTWQRLSILNEVSISNYKGIFAVPYEDSADAAVVHVEGTAAPAEENLNLGKTLLQPVMLKKWISYTDEVRALTDEAFMDYIVDEVMYQVDLLAETLVVNGANNNDEGVVGIINANLTETVSAALTFNAINEGLAAIEEAIDPVVIMNRKTFYGNVMGLVDTQGRPIYQIATDNEGKPRNFINGVRVLFSNGLPAYDNATASQAWAVVGDLKAYKLNLPEGRIPRMLIDELTLAREDKGYVLGRLLAAGNVVKPRSIAKLTKAGE